MTKHLRLIMLSLLAMICLGGYSQSDELAVTLDFTNSSNPWNFPKSYKNDGKAYNYTYNGYTITMQAPENQNCIMFTSYNKHYFLQCYTKGINLTLPQFNFDVTKIVLELYNPTNVTNNIYVNDKDVSTSVKADDQKNSVTCTFDIMQDYQKAGYVYTIKNTGTSRIQKIKIYKPTDIRKDAGISFANNTYTVDFAKGKFEGAKLNNPNKLQVSYTILPEKEGTSIDNNGVVTFAKGVEAKYTVTAKFAGNVIYKDATATYELNVVDPNSVVFDATVDKGAYSSSGQHEKLVKADQYTTTLYGSDAAFNATGKAYRFYASSHMRISVTKGIITKIKLEGNNSQDNPLDKFELLTTAGKITKSTTAEVIWEGSADEVIFNNKAGKQIRISKITVTVKPHYTLDETVDNVIEAKENVYVTLKRTFFHDNAWNTLCLPFDVDANKVATAFAGAEIREIDPNKCTANTIQFVPATEIKAGVPYIIKWNENVAEAKPFEKTFEGVTLIAEPKPVTVNNDITFTGFYNKTTADKLGESVAAIGAENKLFKVTSGEMKGFRAAFVLNSNAQPSAIKLVIDGTATGIEDLVIDGVKANGRVYNLNGQYVGNSLNGLQPGLYIQNGKKIVVK